MKSLINGHKVHLTDFSIHHEIDYPIRGPKRVYEPPTVVYVEVAEELPKIPHKVSKGTNTYATNVEYHGKIAGKGSIPSDYVTEDSGVPVVCDIEFPEHDTKITDTVFTGTGADLREWEMEYVALGTETPSIEES